MSNSIGDLKNSGLKGNNWPWQYKVLLGLDKIVDAIGSTEYEAQIIKATCPGPTPTSGFYLEVRIYNTSTGTFGTPVYYLPGSTTPVNLSACTKEYANDNAVLTQIYTELLEQGLTLDAIETAVEGVLDIRPLTCDDTVSLCFDNAGTPTPVSDTNPLPVNAVVTVPTPLPVSQDPTSNPWIVSGAVTISDGSGPVTVDGTVNIGNFPTSIEVSNDVGNPLPVSGTVAATQSGTWNIAAVTGPVALPTGAATETTLAAVNTKLTPATRTHNTIVATTGPTAIGSVPISLRGSVMNVGSAPGIWNGVSIPAGVAIPWDAVGPRDTYGAIAYNASGTTLIIEYTT